MKFLFPALASVWIVVVCSLWMMAADARLFHGAGGRPGCGPDAAPAAVQAFGITCETFFDGPFTTGAIDVNDTATIANPVGSCANGSCKWYTNPNFANAAIGPNCPGFPGTCPATPASTYSISGGNLTLNRTSAYTAGRVDLLTCHQSGTAPGYFGRVFSTPLYIEFLATTITTGTDSATAEAAVWMHPIDYLTAGVGAITFADEQDLVEGGNGLTKNTNDLQNMTYPPAAQTEYFQSVTPVVAGHANGTLIIPQSRNPNNDGSATGLYQSLDNGSIVASNTGTFSSTAAPKWNGGGFGVGALPPGTTLPDNVVGGMSSLNTAQYCIFLGSGFNIPLTISYLRVWQLPP